MSTASSPAVSQTSAKKCSEWNQFYKEALENASQFNSRLISERRMRLPYLDSHTGVAQNNCHIWFEKHQRGEGLEDGQLYTYPARRWRKRPKMSPAYVDDCSSPNKTSEGDIAEADISLDSFQDETSQDVHSASQDKEQSYVDLYFKEIDPQADFRDAGEIDRAESEESDEDFEISYKKKKSRGRGRGAGRGRKSADGESTPGLSEKADKPFPCKSSTAEPKEGAVDPNNYCDFCLGVTTENKKTGTEEELISCADCGRSGHPSCLQFTDVMIAKVKGYKWQCIECKSCGLCGTSDNDDQLLFCDDCDRGYHMYCLNPPMSAPPEGSWVCDLCKKDGRYDNVEPPTTT